MPRNWQALPELEDFPTVLALKRCLARRLRLPRFRLRVLSEKGDVWRGGSRRAILAGFYSM